MKLFVVTEGGENIGFGHVMRCKSVAAQLKAKNVSVEFIVNDDQRLDGMFNDFIVHRYSLGVESIKSILTFLDKKAVVLVDSYKLVQSDYDALARHASLLACFDDYQRLEYPAGLVINGALDAEKIDYRQRKGVEYLLGVRYAPLRDEFVNVEPKVIRDKVSNVLITMGGDDFRNLTPGVSELLSAVCPEAEIQVVIGGAFKDKEKYVTQAHSKVKYCSGINATQMRNLMQLADFAVTAGGQTLYELARVGTPALVVGVADNQKNNIAAWDSHGFIKFCGWHDDPRLWQNLKSFAKDMASAAVRKTMSNAGSALIDGQGAERIAEAIIQRMKDVGNH